MQARVLPVSEAAIAEAARLLCAGEVIATPTETVYGLAGDAANSDAIARIYGAKRRPKLNPLIIHVLDLAAADELGNLNSPARALAEAHWPGPLTLVVPLRASAPIAPSALAGLNTIAVRVPRHPVIRALLEVTGLALAAPSANASGTISPTRAEHVLRTLGDRIPLVLDGGSTERGLESTIVAATGDHLRLLRPGPIDVHLSSCLASVIEAPGQLSHHYAPSKPMRLDAREARDDEWLIGFGAVAGDSSLSATGNLEEAGRTLFARLHEADLAALPGIAVAPVPNVGLGRAINDRLSRAAA